MESETKKDLIENSKKLESIIKKLESLNIKVDTMIKQRGLKKSYGR